MGVDLVAEMVVTYNWGGHGRLIALKIFEEDRLSGLLEQYAK